MVDLKSAKSFVLHVNCDRTGSLLGAISTQRATRKNLHAQKYLRTEGDDGHTWRKMKLPTLPEKHAEKAWKTMALGHLRRSPSSHEGVSVNLAVEDDVSVEEQKGLVDRRSIF